MNFLELIWLIPLFPLFGALVMLLVGKRLDPQAPSEVALAEGVAPETAGHAPGHGHGGGAKFLISLFCPGMVLLSFLLSAAAVIQLSSGRPCSSMKRMALRKGPQRDPWNRIS